MSHFCINIKNVSPPPFRSVTKTPKVAVVVPVYNVERYLKECLDSILAQTYQNFTIFAVDDGATDRSGEMLDEYAAKHDRVIVTHKSNSGLSSARNAGLSAIEASGTDFEYLYFLDSDDIIPPNFLDDLVRAMERTEADVAVCSVCEFDKLKRHVKPYPTLKSEVLNRDEFAQLYFDFPSYIGTSIAYRFLGNKLFRFAPFKSCRFEEHFKNAEDQEFIIAHVMPAVRKAVVVQETHFSYRLRKSSLSHANKLLQDFDTFSVVIKDMGKYTPSARKGIQGRYIECVYNELRHGFVPGGNTQKQNALIKEARDAALRKWEFPVDLKNRKRLLISYLPKPLISMYFRNRLKQLKKANTHKHYFD